MRLTTFLKEGSARVGAVVDLWIIDLRQASDFMDESNKGTPSFLNNMVSLLQWMDTSFPVVEEIIEAIGQILEDESSPLKRNEFVTPIEEARFLAPVMRPGKVICVGLNYPTPEQEDTNRAPAYPTLFHKVSTSLVGHHGAVIFPRIAREIVYEGELALVIGKTGKYIEREHALSFIAGYTVANDIGSPDLERRTSQWTTGKMMDTFCPLGPYLVTNDDVPDPNNLRIRTTLNGEVLQDGRTSEMIFDIPDLVCYISNLVTLEPGDIILTGSPKRNGDQPDPRTSMRPGDVVCVEVERVGKLCNPIITESGI